MAVSRRMGLELVFNLQWRNKLDDNGGDKANNVIGMYDTPATTQNFEIFKSYLLKNSGVAGNDVKVTYITDNDNEWIIESQQCFEIALCAFRLKARLGEIIFLKLDKISDGIVKMMPIKKTSNDVETQYNENCNNSNNYDNPPEWFINYMQRFKNDLVDEITFAVANNLNNIDNKPTLAPIPCQLQELQELRQRQQRQQQILQPAPSWHTPGKKYKSERESSKRSRKHHSSDTPMDYSKEVMKSLKYDRKLEAKLDKLDAKAKKTVEKRLALINKAGGVGTLLAVSPSLLKNTPSVSNSKHCDATILLSDGLMNASTTQNTNVKPRMLGGENYLHTWEVINTGEMPWTSKTELRLTWGSVDMKPAVKNIPVPRLKPGETGYISVLFLIPKKPGKYESYWSFYDKNCRFGNYLSFCVVVRPDEIFDSLDNGLMQLDDTYTFKKMKICHDNYEKQQAPEKEEMINEQNYAKSCPNNVLLSNLPNEDKQEINEAEDKLKDFDLESVESLSAQEEDNKNETFTFLPVPNGSFKLSDEDEEQLAIDLTTLKVNKDDKNDVKQEDKKQNDGNNNIDDNMSHSSSTSSSICKLGTNTPSELSYNMVSLSDNERDGEDGAKEEYVYVNVGSNKLLLPKHILSREYLANNANADEKCTTTENNVVEEKQSETVKQEVKQLNENNYEMVESYVSHCSAVGSCFSDLNTVAKQDNNEEEDGNEKLFVFSQRNGGFAVKYSEEEGENVDNAIIQKMDKAEVAESGAYTWAQSDTKYTLADIQQSFAQDYMLYWPTASSNHHERPKYEPIPNYQETMERAPQPHMNGASPVNSRPQQQPQQQNQQQPTAPAAPIASAPPVHILPENLMTGAVNVASSAINTARSVINMIVPPSARSGNDAGQWVNGHWVTNNPESKRAKNLRVLYDMGFWDRDLNASLLARYNDDLNRVVSELVQ